MTDRPLRRVYIETFGCQMNDYDSARMLRLLEMDGYQRAQRARDADVIILNTCAVRDKAEQKALSQLGRYKKLRRTNPGVKFVLAGCMAQRAARELRHRHPYLDLVMGTDAIPRLPQRLRDVHAGASGVIDVGFDAAYAEDADDFGEIVPGKGSPVSAFVTIMRGCDNFCAYCVVPYVRGRERSRDVEDVLREVRHLTARGVREITLLGQNVNSYGNDRGDLPDFPALLAAVHEVPDLARLRFTTSHPKDVSDALIDAFATLPKLANHIHLPVQAGSDAVLAAMGRGYNVAHYLDLVARLRAARPDLAITTDLLVGFPGETDSDFADTLALLEKADFSNAFSFRYSVRPGTAAAKLDDDVPDPEKIRRLMALQEVQREVTFRRHRELVGKEVVVLVEKASARDDVIQWSGKSGCYREVHFTGGDVAVGDLVPVKCLEAFANHLLGRRAGDRSADERS